MIDLDGYTFTLPQHRKEDDPPRWVYALPSADDVLGARRSARSARQEQRAEEGKPDDDAGGDVPSYAAALDDLDMEVFAITLTARSLREVHNLLRGGSAITYPADAPIGERIAWVRRLPFSWIVALSTAIQSEGDIDDEEEVSPAATLGGPDHEQAGSLPVLDVPANGAAAAGV